MQNPISRLKTFFVRLQSTDTTNEAVLTTELLELQLDAGQMLLPQQTPFMLELPNQFEEVVLRWKGDTIVAEVRRIGEVGLVDGADTPNNPLESESFKSRGELAKELAPHVSMTRSGLAETFTFHLDPDMVKENKHSQNDQLVSGIQKIEGMLVGVSQTLQRHSNQLDSLLIQSERCQSVEKKTASRNGTAKPQTKRPVGIQDVLDSTAASPPRILKKNVSPSPRVEAFSLTDTRTRKTRVTMSGLSGALQRLNNTQEKYRPCQMTANLSLDKPKGFGTGHLLVQSKNGFSAINKVLAGVRPRLKKSRRTPSHPAQPTPVSFDPRHTYPSPDIPDVAPGVPEHHDLHTLIRDLKGLTQEIQPVATRDEGTPSKQLPKHRESSVLPEGAKKYWMLPNPRHLPQLPTN